MWPSLFLVLALSAPDEGSEPITAFADTVVVTASRLEEPVTEAPAPVTVVPRDELEASPALTLDEALRQVPGFSLFRRSSSLDSHPTTQGVSLRGIGPSGTSRSVVLYDGIPLNDPFGGWIAWNRLPSSALATVEVASGAGSPLWGSSALGGTIHLRPRPATADTLEILTRGGERGLAGVEVFAADRSTGPGDWGWTLAGHALRTNGFFLLDPAIRGAVDRPAGVGFEGLTARLDQGRFHLGAQLYREERENGTELQTNDSRLALLEAGFRGERLSWSLHGQWQRFESTFSRVFPDRDEEILTARQEVPATAFGGSITFEPRRFTGLLVGADVRRVIWRDGAEGSQDLDQDLAGVFAHKRWRAGGRFEIVAGARLDRWDNRDVQTVVSPRLALVARLSDRATVRASAYRGFRAPTLNELYRPFRVGNVVTEANPDLDEERLTGIETGLDLVSRSRGARRLWTRLNAFYNVLDDPVGNVTVAVEPDLVLRRRRNQGEVEIPGLEAEAGAAFGDRLSLRARYLFSDPEVRDTGRRLPQVPEHQATLRFEARVFEIVSARKLRWVLESHWAGDAFEDDLEELPLGEAFQIDVSVAAPLTRQLTVTLAVDNLLDERVTVGRLPEERLGAPRTVWMGLGWRRWDRTAARRPSPRIGRLAYDAGDAAIDDPDLRTGTLRDHPRSP